MNYHQNHCNSFLIPLFHPCPIHLFTSPFKNVNQIPSIFALYNTFPIGFPLKQSKSEHLPVAFPQSSTSLACPLGPPRFSSHSFSFCHTGVLTHCSSEKPAMSVPHGSVLAVVLVSNTFPSCFHNLLPHLLQVTLILPHRTPFLNHSIYTQEPKAHPFSSPQYFVLLLYFSFLHLSSSDILYIFLFGYLLSISPHQNIKQDIIAVLFTGVVPVSRIQPSIEYLENIC